MVIKKLHMHNFGVYAGDNEFVFNSHKPVVLIPVLYSFLIEAGSFPRHQAT